MERLTFLQLIVFANSIFCLATNITKASIVFLYLRIFEDKAFKASRWICYGILLLILFNASWGAFLGLFACHPMASLWDPSIHGKCFDAATYWLTFAALNVALDFIIFLLPIPLIRQLKLPSKQIRLLSIIFLVGGL